MFSKEAAVPHVRSTALAALPVEDELLVLNTFYGHREGDKDHVRRPSELCYSVMRDGKVVPVENPASFDGTSTCTTVLLVHDSAVPQDASVAAQKAVVDAFRAAYRNLGKEQKVKAEHTRRQIESLVLPNFAAEEQLVLQELDRIRDICELAGRMHRDMVVPIQERQALQRTARSLLEADRELQSVVDELQQARISVSSTAAFATPRKSSPGMSPDPRRFASPAQKKNFGALRLCSEYLGSATNAFMNNQLHSVFGPSIDVSNELTFAGRVGPFVQLYNNNWIFTAGYESESQEHLQLFVNRWASLLNTVRTQIEFENDAATTTFLACLYLSLIHI